MHELSIASGIVEICAERAGAARVIRVRLEIGMMSAVLPVAIRGNRIRVHCSAVPLVRSLTTGRSNTAVIICPTARHPRRREESPSSTDLNSPGWSRSSFMPCT